MSTDIESIAPIRIAMWAGPRNISTTMMRSFENRPDTAVLDEPFYAHYLRQSSAPHPMRQEAMASLPQDFDGVVAQLNGPAPDGAPVFFHKHIAYHFPDDGAPLDWINDQRSFLLIRNPRAMIASYSKKFTDVAPIIKSLDVQLRIKNHQQGRGAPCPVVDATDILKNPEAMISGLCAALDIPFTEKMLSWPAGRRESDGVWAPHWYDAVESSTGFRPYEKKPVTLTPALEKIAEACADAYETLHAARLTP